MISKNCASQKFKVLRKCFIIQNSHLYRDGNAQGPFRLKCSGSRGVGGGLNPFLKTNFAHFEAKTWPLLERKVLNYEIT